ncbi:CoA-binding protein [Undibacterium sp.]|jgi:predicted CoA-binding protein|uniref:CoA-binding protein n=1 Tax=Undibacterium sp. TaxID=1914977 RepID=UPI002B843A9C|nr:CoA-binding protein [Undibacterium sp.]HTD03127.1 CoA-binding protein [Undibacterium sp.]
MMLNADIAATLRQARTVAVVGLSARSHRPSYAVAAYLQQQGYRIIPVNPKEEGTSILGEHCYASLDHAVQAAQRQGRRIDIVDCFRRSAEIPPIVNDAIRLGLGCVWMQQGVINDEAAGKALQAGIKVVMDRCIKVDHTIFNIPRKE